MTGQPPPDIDPHDGDPDDSGPPAVDDGGVTIWVSSEVAADGTYVIGLSAGPDLAWSLPERAARQHAAHAIAVATAAEHDSATVRLLTTVGIPMTEIAMVLRDARLPRTLGPTSGPVRFDPSVRMDGKPFIRVLVHGSPVGQMSPAQLREHGTAVLTALAAVRLDNRMHAVLTRTLDVGDDQARAFIATLAKHWPPPTWPTPADGGRDG